MRMLADGALLLELSNADALDLAAALAVAPPPGFLDAVPGARTLLVLFDPARFDPSSLEAVRKSAPRPPPRTVRLRTVYDGEDLPAIAAQTGLAIPELVRLHTQAVHTVAFLGFAPGFAYLTGAPLPLAVPRLKTPRLRVPAGSVAVADGYSGVYPLDSPGGWRLIGRVAERMFDVDASPPALLRPGDRVVFEAVGELAATSAPIKLPPQGAPVLRAIAPGPLTTVQGGPRYGLSASGVPAGGAMDLPALAAANALLGNAPDVAGLEFTIAGPELEALAEVRVAANGAVRDLRKGDRIKIGMLEEGARGYIAVEGGLAQPHPGERTRALLKGDELTRPPASGWVVGPRPPSSGRAVGPRPETRGRRPVPGDAAGVLHLRALPGPQLDHFPAPERFFAAEYTLSPQSDRRGLRLKGPPLSPLRADIPPEGTAPGAVQVPGDGLPIVLGPDRPVTGGYPKIATVISADLPLLAQARPGARIRFLQVDLAEALRAREEAHEAPGARGGQP
jgi:KipI family sensor histidine kinase inhibitor